MNSKVQQTPYEQYAIRPPKGLRVIAVMRQMFGRFYRARPSRFAVGPIAVLFLALGVLSSALSAVEPTIHGASLGPEVMYTQGAGDTWYATWADDGDLYVTSDD